MDGTKSLLQPKPLSELLPELTGILSRDSALTLSSKKGRTVMPRSVDKSSIKPKTIAELQADILALRPPSAKRCSQPTSAMKAKWNSSVKVARKNISHTGDKSNQKHASVRKVLNFQSKPKPQALFNSEISATPKFIKPEPKPKKSILPYQGKNSVRISGVYAITQTPLESTKAHPISRLNMVNKENMSAIANINRKSFAPPHITVNNKKIIHLLPDTSLSNVSSDASFLLKEKEINELELRNCNISEPTLENIAEVSPPMSTPFKDYRSVHEYFNDNSDSMDKSKLEIDNTVICFDKTCVNTVNEEDSVIASMCDLLSKATISNIDKSNSELKDLMDMEQQTMDSIKYIENCITVMSKVKSNHETTLKNIRKLINNIQKPNEERTEVVEQVELSVKTQKTTVNDVTNNVSVIKYTRSPSYTLPKRKSLRKKVFHKSMPTALNANSPESKIGSTNRAISMYLEMKEKMTFLNTPLAKKSHAVPSTPAVTSQNLQIQLDRLYNAS